jgi:glycosyltransferase involved in cell wall biosynthesis
MDGASQAGHKVHVICGGNEYVAYEFGNEISIRHDSSVGADFNGYKPGHGTCDIRRVSNLTFSHNFSRKLLSYATFYAGATWKALTAPKPDVVLTLTAPPGLAWIGWLMQRVFGCTHVVWEMDVYPDIAVALGMPYVGWLGGLLDYPRRRADRVIALGDCMKKRLLGHAILQERICVAENWADGSRIYPLPFPDLSPLRILYSGNFGLAHDAATIRGVMDRLAGDSRFHFDFAGGGPGRKDLADFCQREGIGNVSFWAYAPQRQLGESLAKCHIGLVTQKAGTLGAVVPSKVYGLMAAGRPILYIGPSTAMPALLIGKFSCGWHFDCDDVEGVLELLTYLLGHPEEIHRKGECGRKAFMEHYDRPAGVARICRALGLETTDFSSAELTRSSRFHRSSQFDGLV